jgi:hypothetical protein
VVAQDGRALVITIFAVPKPFRGAIATAQHNSLASWRALDGDAQIILVGDEAGVAEAAARHGVEHVAEVRRNAQGTPLLDDAFATARARARHDRLAYVNADIILMPDFLRAVQLVTFARFLMVGCRLDLDLDEAIDVGRADWTHALVRRARLEGRPHPPLGSDYFVLPARQPLPLPPFPVGRALWDNWMIYDARRRGIAVVDATEMVTAVHQNHDYGHLRGGQREVYDGAEAQRNRELLGRDFVPLTIEDATFRLGPAGPRRALDLRHLWRRAALWPALSPRLRGARALARALKRSAG